MRGVKEPKNYLPNFSFQRKCNQTVLCQNISKMDKLIVISKTYYLYYLCHLLEINNSGFKNLKLTDSTDVILLQYLKGTLGFNLKNQVNLEYVCRSQGIVGYFRPHISSSQLGSKMCNGARIKNFQVSRDQIPGLNF